MGRQAGGELSYSDQAVRKAIRDHVESGAKAQRELRISGLPGFVLIVRPTGAAAFHLFYSGHDGVRRRPKLGEFPAMALATAREKAVEVRNAIDAGRDPVADTEAAKVASAGATTLRELAEQKYTHSLAAGDMRPYTVLCYRRNLLHDAVPLLDLPVTAITRVDVQKCIDAVAARGAARKASHLRSALSAIFNFGLDRVPGLTVSPVPRLARTKGNRAKSRERVLTDAELRLLWRRLANDEFEGAATGEGSVGMTRQLRVMMQIVILTGQRRAEVAGIRLDELDLDSAEPTWTIPGDTTKRGRTSVKVAGRTKNGREQTVPLAPAAVTLMREAIELRAGRGGDCLFPSRLTNVKHGSAGPKHQHIDPHSITRASRRFWASQGMAGDVTVHDIRRTAATWAGSAGFAPHVISAMLNHTPQSVTAIYNRSRPTDQVRLALAAWASHVCGDGVAASAGSNVLALRPAAMAG